MRGEDDWVLVGEYSAPYQADLDIAMLKEAGIPVLSKGPPTGVFGPGFAGATSVGVRVYVPRELADEAREILGLPSGD